MGRLVAVLGRLGGVLGRLEATWGRLGASWRPRGASCGRLGSFLAVFHARFSIQRGLNLGMLSWMPFFNGFLHDFASQNRSSNIENSLNSIGKIGIFCLQAILT